MTPVPLLQSKPNFFIHRKCCILQHCTLKRTTNKADRWQSIGHLVVSSWFTSLFFNFSSSAQTTRVADKTIRASKSFCFYQTDQSTKVILRLEDRSTTDTSGGGSSFSAGTRSTSSTETSSYGNHGENN